MSKMREAFEKYQESRRTMIAYHGGTCNEHDFEAGYQAAIAAIREGGTVGYIHLGDPDSGDYKALFEYLNGDCQECVPIYKLPEDLL